MAHTCRNTQAEIDHDGGYVKPNPFEESWRAEKRAEKRRELLAGGTVYYYGKELTIAEISEDCDCNKEHAINWALNVYNDHLIYPDDELWL